MDQIKFHRLDEVDINHLLSWPICSNVRTGFQEKGGKGQDEKQKDDGEPGAPREAQEDETEEEEEVFFITL